MKRPVAPSEMRIGMDVATTPLIDVVFQLLIFFLATMGFAIPESILPTELPAEAREPQPAQPFSDLEFVHVRLAGRGAALSIDLNRRRLAEFAELTAQLNRLAKAAPDLPVILDIAPEVFVEHVVRAYDECLSAGFTRVSFATEKKS
jgi:biopolymer transport protein ExbD